MRCLESHPNNALRVSALRGQSTALPLVGPHSALGLVKVLAVHENTWDTMIRKFRRYRHCGNWMDVAGDANRWSNLMPQFLTFWAHTVFYFPCAVHWLCGHTSFTSFHFTLVSHAFCSRSHFFSVFFPPPSWESNCRLISFSQIFGAGKISKLRSGILKLLMLPGALHVVKS